MKLQKIVNRLQKLHPKEIDLSLDRVKNLCKKLGDPQKKLKYISVVGGGEGLYGNGETSFEVLTSEAEDVEGHIGKDRVTEILLELQEDDSD